MRRILFAGLVALWCAAPGHAQLAAINGCSAASLSVSAVSSNVQLSKCAPIALIQNVGTAEAFYVLGATSGTTATTSNFSIPASSYQLVYVGANGAWLAAIAASGTTTLRITQSVQ